MSQSWGTARGESNRCPRQPETASAARASLCNRGYIRRPQTLHSLSVSPIESRWAQEQRPGSRPFSNRGLPDRAKACSTVPGLP